jgi:hypothetical protein
MEDHKGGSKASLKQNPTQDPALVRKERIEHTKPKQLTVPVFDRHFNPGSALPSFGDNSLLEVLSALYLRIAQDANLQLAPIPASTTSTANLANDRIRAIMAVVKGDIDAWCEITTHATLLDVQSVLACFARLGWKA